MMAMKKVLSFWKTGQRISSQRKIRHAGIVALVLESFKYQQAVLVK